MSTLNLRVQEGGVPEPGALKASVRVLEDFSLVGFDSNPSTVRSIPAISVCLAQEGSNLLEIESANRVPS